MSYWLDVAVAQEQQRDRLAEAEKERFIRRLLPPRQPDRSYLTFLGWLIYLSSMLRY